MVSILCLVNVVSGHIRKLSLTLSSPAMLAAAVNGQLKIISLNNFVVGYILSQPLVSWGLLAIPHVPCCWGSGGQGCSWATAGRLAGLGQ